MPTEKEEDEKRSFDPKWIPLIVAALGIFGTIGGVLLGQHLSLKSALTQKAIDYAIEERREANEFIESFSLATGERTYAAGDLQFALQWKGETEAVAEAEKEFLATRKRMIVRNGFFIAGFQTRFGEDFKRQYVHLTTRYDRLDGLLSEYKSESSEETGVEILKAIDEVNVEQGFIIGRAMSQLNEQ